MKAILFLFLFLCGSSAMAQEPPPTKPPPTEEVAPAVADEEPSAKEAPAVEQTPAPEDASPQTDEEAVDAATSFVDAINNQNWTLAFAFGVMVLVYLVRKLGLMKKVPKDALVWVSIGLGVLVAVAAAIIDGADMQTALIQGAVLGLTGAGMWNAGGKHGTKLMGALALDKDEPPEER